MKASMQVKAMISIKPTWSLNTIQRQPSYTVPQLDSAPLGAIHPTLKN